MAARQSLPSGRVDRRFKLRELHVLSAVVDAGSMVKAAAQLGMSQPAVSAAIANLETALGVRLLDRSPRGIEPTLYSEALLRRGRVAFDELRQALRDIEFLLDPASGEVRVGCPEGAVGFVSAVIDRLSRLYPRVVVHVVTAQTGTQTFRELRERKVDIMLGRLFTPVRDEEIDVDTIAQDRLFVVSSSHAPWARRRRVALAELIDEPWILYPTGTVVADFHAGAFRRHGLELPARHVIAYSLDVRMHLLATGRYLAILGSMVLQYNSAPWSLKRLPIDLHVPPMPVAIFTLRDRTISPVAGLFVEQARLLAKAGARL